MSEAGDYNPVDWRGHDFSSARKAYRSHVNSSYSDARSKGTTTRDLVPTALSTGSSCPLVIACDVTGSMGEWPATIFSKLPYLEHEAKTEYLAEDVEVSFAAVGDCTCDTYPLQARPFVRGKDLATRLKELVVEGGGGGSTHESYQLTALYYARCVEVPGAVVKPVLIFIGDESPYDVVTVAEAATAHCSLQADMSTADVFAQLKSKFSVYFIQKPYGGANSNNWREPTTARVTRDWIALVGADYMAYLPEAGRVVDTVFGILAQEANRVDYFEDEMRSRQTPEQCDVVFRSLHSIHKRSRGLDDDVSRSRMHTRSRDSKPSDPLV